MHSSGIYGADHCKGPSGVGISPTSIYAVLPPTSLVDEVRTRPVFCLLYDKKISTKKSIFVVGNRPGSYVHKTIEASTAVCPSYSSPAAYKPSSLLVTSCCAQRTVHRSIVAFARCGLAEALTPPKKVPLSLQRHGRQNNFIQSIGVQSRVLEGSYNNHYCFVD